MKTLTHCARLALDVQDACNLSGVAYSFSQILGRLWEEARETEHGTNWVNSHPISVLFASKIAELTGCNIPEKFNAAYHAVCKMAEDK